MLKKLKRSWWTLPGANTRARLIPARLECLSMATGRGNAKYDAPRFETLLNRLKKSFRNFSVVPQNTPKGYPSAHLALQMCSFGFRLPTLHNWSFIMCFRTSVEFCSFCTVPRNLHNYRELECLRDSLQ